MSKHAEAELILKLYDLRREHTMRAARDWYFREFHPQSMQDIHNTMFSEHSGHLRQVLSYWDMAAALVNHGAIGLDFFSDTNGEHLSTFAKVEPFLAEARAAYNPNFLQNLEKLIDSTVGGKEKTAAMRERMKSIRSEMEARRSHAAG